MAGMSSRMCSFEPRPERLNFIFMGLSMSTLSRLMCSTWRREGEDVGRNSKAHAEDGEGFSAGAVARRTTLCSLHHE